MQNDTATTRYEANTAPDDLGLVQELANTVAVGPGADLLETSGSATSWVASVSDHTPAPLDATSLERLRQLRAAVRSTLNADETGQPLHVALRLRISRDGVSVDSDGPDLLEARITVALLRAQATGSLSRLKLCANPDCRVAFYDQSKNGAGKWHSSNRCGNTARVRAHRDRTNI